VRILKKLIAALVMVSILGFYFPSVLAIDSESGISPEAKICADIGILRGTDINGVTIAYTQSSPTRIQAAILFLRMKGLENAALAYKGTKNFKDYKTTYTSGRKVMAYIKSHSSLGFVGYANGNFYPNRLISSQQFYKVILTALGYVQDKDFTYGNVFTFAAAKGLTRLNANTYFTVDSMAVALVEGLRATLKTGNSTLVEKLISLGVLDENAVIISGLIVTPTPSPTLPPTPTPTPTTIQTLSPTSSPNPNETFPLKLSANGRYMTDINNNPYYLSIDTGWMIFSYINREDAEYYLENRRQHGVNTILCYAAPFHMPRENAYGETAFLDNNLSIPNDAYFENVDWVINKAAEKGMQVLMCPFELANYTNYDYNYGMTVDSAKAIGRYMGNRYKDFRNILWSTGGDTAPDYEQTEITLALVEGIREYDTTHLMSFHPRGGLSSSEFFHNETWLNFNMTQCFSPDSSKSYTLARDDYTLNPVKPTILIEPPYEDGGTGGSNTAQEVRRAVTFGSLSGTFGLCYGNGVVYNFGSNSSKDWKPYLDHSVFLQTQSLAECINSREWFKLQPDQTDSLITDGGYSYGSLNYAATSIASDKSFSISYIPTARDITVDMTVFIGSKTLKWFDMTDNTYTTIGTYPNSGSVNLPAQPENSEGQTDWLLIVE
jgi:hypothetical protein